MCFPGVLVTSATAASMCCCNGLLARSAGLRGRQQLCGDQPEGHRPRQPGHAGQGGHPGAAVSWFVVCVRLRMLLSSQRRSCDAEPQQ